MTSINLKKNTIDYLTIGFLLLLFIINYIWFASYNFSTLMGDDLFSYNLFSNHTSFLQYAFFEANFGKYRPVYNIIQYILFNAFGTNYQLFFHFNILFNFIIVSLLFLIVKIITNNKWIALLVGIMYITARFSYYNILQLYGLMEAVCLFLLLAIVLCSIFLYRTNKMYYLYAILALDLLLIFTHERYIVITPFILGLILFQQSIHIRARYILMVVACLPVLLNISIKMFVLDTKVLEGTGGVSIGFDFVSIITFFICGILNLLGINIGAAYLNGFPFQSADWITKLLSVGILLVIVFTIILYIKKIIKLSAKNRIRELKIAALVFLLIFSLLAASSITIRQEYRWLYAPFILFMLYLSYLWSFIRIKKRYAIALLMIFVIFSLRNDLVYKEYATNIFFVGAQHIAETTYNETIKKFGTNLDNYSVYIERHSTFSWTLQDSMFFQVYTENKEFKVNYVDDIKAVDFTGKTEGDTLILRLNPYTAVMENITEEFIFNRTGEYGYETIAFNTWAAPDSNYPARTLAGHKLYYKFVSKYNKNRGVELSRIDDKSFYTLSQNAISDSTVSKLEPGSFSYYNSNDLYDLVWISVPDDGIISWDLNLHRYK